MDTRNSRTISPPTKVKAEIHAALAESPITGPEGNVAALRAILGAAENTAVGREFLSTLEARLAAMAWRPER